MSWCRIEIVKFVHELFSKLLYSVSIFCHRVVVLAVHTQLDGQNWKALLGVGGGRGVTKGVGSTLSESFTGQLKIIHPYFPGLQNFDPV